MDNRTEWETVLRHNHYAGRGEAVMIDRDSMLVLFTRIQAIYSTEGVSRNRVWDVVDYGQNENGRHVGTYCDVRTPRKLYFAK